MPEPQRFRKKPVEIEAMQFTADTYEALWAWLPSDKHMFIASPGRDMTLHIDTLEGTMVAREGDWIIRGIKGEFYPCRADIFDATYEPVQENRNA